MHMQYCTSQFSWVLYVIGKNQPEDGGNEVESLECMCSGGGGCQHCVRKSASTGHGTATGSTKLPGAHFTAPTLMGYSGTEAVSAR